MRHSIGSRDFIIPAIKGWWENNDTRRSNCFFGANLEGTVDDLGMLQADDIQHYPTVREHVFPCANPRVQTVASLENVSPRRWGAKHWAEGLKNVIIRYIRKTITMPSWQTSRLLGDPRPSAKDVLVACNEHDLLEVTGNQKTLKHHQPPKFINAYKRVKQLLPKPGKPLRSAVPLNFSQTPQVCVASANCPPGGVLGSKRPGWRPCCTPRPTVLRLEYDPTCGAQDVLTKKKNRSFTVHSWDARLADVLLMVFGKSPVNPNKPLINSCYHACHASERTEAVDTVLVVRQFDVACRWRVMEHNLPSSSGIPVGDDDTLTPSSILQENQHLKLFTKSHYANEDVINDTVPTWY